MIQYTTVTSIFTFSLIRSISRGKITWQRDGQDVRLARRRTAFILPYPTGKQKLNMHTDFKMTPRPLKLNAAAQTMNSDVSSMQNRGNFVLRTFDERRRKRGKRDEQVGLEFQEFLFNTIQSKDLGVKSVGTKVDFLPSNASNNK